MILYGLHLSCSNGDITPIICAIQNNHLSIVKYLYEQGANIYLQK
jgi:ankyrin repeat protein